MAPSTFADALLGVNLGAVLHGVNRKVDLGPGLLLLAGDSLVDGLELVLYRGEGLGALVVGHGGEDLATVVEGFSRPLKRLEGG